MTDAKLTVELVPETSFFVNMRSMLTKSKWDAIRKSVYAAAGNRCEVCGGRGSYHAVECHEVWRFIEDGEGEGVQRLERLVALCPACHEVKHFGLACVRGRDGRALSHLMQVNAWTREQAQKHVAEAFALWRARSRKEWRVDITTWREGEK